MTDKPKALYIGDPRVEESLEKIHPEWDFQPSVKTIKEMWENAKNGKLDKDISVILVLDLLFKEDGSDTSFEKMIALMGAHCFVGIINYRPKLRDTMEERIQYEAENLGVDAPESVLFYFIDIKSTLESFRKSLKRFSNQVQELIDNRIPNIQDLVNVSTALTGRTYDQNKVDDLKQKIYDDDDQIEDQEEEDYSDNKYLGQIVTVTSSKGGSGKSTTAITLATYLAHASINSAKEKLEERPLKIIIVDLNTRDGQLGFVTGHFKPTILHLFQFDSLNEEAINSIIIPDNRLKLDLILASKKPRQAQNVTPEIYVDLIHKLRRMYDYIIFDTSVEYLDPLLEKVAYPIADQIVFVTEVVINAVFSMTRWIQEVTTSKDRGGMGIQKNKIGIVINKSLSGVNMPGSMIQKSALGLPVITVVPSSPKLITHATNIQHIEVILKQPEIRSAYRRLARAIVGKKYKLSDNVD